MEFARKFADIGVGKLGDEVSAALGRVVSITVTDLGGRVDIVATEPATGEEKTFDRTVIEPVVMAHVKPTPPVDPAEALESALAEANTVARIRDALLVYARSQKRPPRTIK